jgi:hypothetical protein
MEGGDVMTVQVKATAVSLAAMAFASAIILASFVTGSSAYVAHRGATVRGGAGAYHRGTTVARHGGAYHRGTTVVGPRGGVYHRGTTVAGHGAWGIRPWAARPYFGTVVAGVTLGTIIAATAYNVAPPPPASNLCWYWTDSSRIRGYWSYCD